MTHKLPTAWLHTIVICGATLPALAQGQTVEQVPQAFRDLDQRNTALVLPLGGKDEDGVGLQIGFPFSFFGQVYTSVTVTTNGYLTFGNSIAPLNEPIPTDFSPNGVIAPFWDDFDLRHSADAKVLFERQGDLGKQVLVVQWTRVPLKADPASRLSFQVILFEATGEIQFQYGALKNGDGTTGGRASGSSATIGLESGDGLTGIQLAFNQAGAVTSQGRGVAFLPGPALPAGRKLGDLDGDGRVTVLDQSRLVELGHPAFPPASALELIASDIAPLATTATALWGDGAVDRTDRDVMSLAIVKRITLSPYLSELQPARAPPGSGLTLTGSNFDATTPGNNRITFVGTGGQTLVVPAQTVDAAGGSLTVQVPTAARRGLVFVTTVNRRTNARLLTPAGIPAILSANPKVGVIGGEVTIDGVEFPTTIAGTTVTLGGVPLTITSVTPGVNGANDTIVAQLTGPLTPGTQALVVAAGPVTSEPFPYTISDLPTAKITFPARGGEVRDRIQIVGTASDPNDFARYELAYAPLDGERTYTTFHTSTAPVTSGNLGQFDPTILINGYYVLRLTVTDSRGLTAVDEVPISVQGFVKLGQFTLTFLDLELPASGIAIRVYRDYDSRDKRIRDFGVGWRLRLVTLFVEESENHDVTIQNPISSRTEYRFTPEQVNPFDPRFHTAKFTTTEPGELSRLDFESPEGVDPGNKILVKDVVGNFLWFPENIPFDPRVYRMTQADGTVLRIDDRDGLLQILTPAGPTLTITPNGFIHSSGRSTTFDRDALGRITKITDPRGNELRYEYSPAGDLVKHTDAEGFSETFTYRSDHHLLEWLNPSGHRVTKNEYNDAGLLIATVDALGKRIELEHDLDGRREIVRDRLGRPTISEYDTLGRLVKLIGHDGIFETYTYNAQNRMTQRIDRRGGVWTYEYDARGFQTKFTDPAQNTIRYTYDDRGNLLTVVDADGGLTTYTYNAQNKVTSSLDAIGAITTRVYDGSGNLTLSTNEAGESTTYAYNDQGDLTKRVDPTGQVTLFTHDPNGNVVTTTRVRTVPGQPSVRATTTFKFDKANRRTSVLRPDGTSEQKRYGGRGRLEEQTDSGGRRQLFGYDEAGRMTQRIGGDGRVEVREYDATGSLIAIADKQGRRSMTVNARGQPTAINFADGSSIGLSYDAIGNLTSRTDARGHTWSFEYDGVGRRTKQTDPKGGVTVWTYDGKGNVTSITDPDLKVTLMEYDPLGRLLKTTFPDGRIELNERDLAGRIVKRTDPTGRVSEFAYSVGDLDKDIKTGGGFTRFARNEQGQVLSQTNLAGHATRFGYDSTTGQRTSVTLPLGQTATFEWTEGQVTKQVDFDGRMTTKEYDGRGHLVFRVLPDGTGERVTWSEDGRQIVAVEDVNGEIKLRHDAVGRVTSRTETDGRSIGYSYDPDGRVKSITTPQGTVTYDHDELGRLTSVTDVNSQTTTYSYTAGGRPETITRPNGVVTTLDVDPMGRLLSVSHARAGIVIAGYTYTYDPVSGNKTRVVETHSGREVQYRYDGLLRLTSETISEGAAVTSTTYSYDVLGNRTQKQLIRADGTIETRTYAYDANDRLLTESVADTNSAVVAHVVSYSYDASGNTLRREAPGELTTYGYDGVGRVSSIVVVKGVEQHEVVYRYDHFGNRIQTIRDGVLTQHLVDGNRKFARVLVDTDAAGNVLRVFAHGDQPVSLRTGAGETHYFLQDGQLSVRALVDSAGAVSAAYDYDAYGVTLRETGTVESPLRYTGEQFEPLTGLVFLRSRYLDSRLGRFLSRDTFEGFRHDPPTLHPYVYALDNPVNLIDPPGTFPTSLLVVVTITVPAFLLAIAHAQDVVAKSNRLRDERMGWRSLLSDVNSFLPHSLDILGSDKDLALVQALLFRALEPGIRKKSAAQLSLAARTSLFGAKVYGRMGADLAMGSATTPSGKAKSAATRLLADANLYRKSSRSPASIKGRESTDLFQEIKAFLVERENVGVKDVAFFARQREAGVNGLNPQVGVNRPDIQFTVIGSNQRWAIMLSSSTEVLVSQIERIVANDPKVIACEIRDDAEFESFVQALRYNCDSGPPAPFLLSLKRDPSGGVPQIIKDAIPERNKRAPLPQNQVVLGDGVYANSGEFVLRRVDLTVPGRGLNWEFTRTYRSGVIFQNEPGFGPRANFHLGHNWSTNYDERLGGVAGGVLEIDSIGRIVDTYLRDLKAKGAELPHRDARGRFATILRTGVHFRRVPLGAALFDDLEDPYEDHREIGFIRRSADGRIETFNSAGWLVKINDRHQNTIYLVRDEDHLLRLAIDTVGRQYSYEYERILDQNTLVSVRDITGNRTIKFDYDRTNLDLTGVTSPEGRTERYTYSSTQQSRPVHPALLHNLVSVIYPEQVRSGELTPAIVNVYQSQDPSAFDFDSVILQTKGAQSKIRPIGTPSGSTRVVNSGGVSTFSYREVSPFISISDTNRVASITTYNDRAGFESEIRLNRGGNAVSVRDAGGYVTSSRYTEDGLLQSRTMPNGQVTYFGYPKDPPISAQRSNLLYQITFPAPAKHDERTTGPDDPPKESFRPIVREFDYEPLFNQVRRVTETRGFDPVTRHPTAADDPRTFLTESSEYENYTRRTFYDYEESASRPGLPVLLIFGLRYTWDAILAPRTGRWAVTFHNKDLNGDQEKGPTGPVDLSGPGIRGIAVKTQGRRVRLDEGTDERTRRGPHQVAETLAHYNEHGQVTLSVDSEGNATALLYYSDGIVAGGRHPGYIEAVVRDTNPPAAAAALIPRTSAITSFTKAVTLYAYDSFGNPSEIIDPRGVKYTKEWDFDNLLIKEQLATDTLNYRRSYTWNDNRRLESELVEDKGPAEPSQQGFERQLRYDILDNLVEEGRRLDGPQGSSTWLVTRHTYDPRELPKRTTYPLGGNTATVWEFDSRRLRTKETRGPSVKSADGKESTVQWGYDETGNVKLTILPDGDQVKVLRDGFDRPRFVISPNGTVQFLDYDTEGNLVRTLTQGSLGGDTPRDNSEARNERLSETHLVRDDLYRVKLIRELAFASGGSIAIDETTAVTRVEHDRLGRPYLTVEPDLQRMEMKFDGLSRVVETIDHLGNRDLFTYDVNSNLLSRTEIERATLSSGGAPLVPDETFTSTFKYDPLNRVSEATDPAGQVSRFAYDSRSNVIQSSDSQAVVIDGVQGTGNTIRHRFDSVNRLVETAYDLRPNGLGGGTATSSIRVLREYDANSRLTAVVDPNDNRTTYEYDALNRKILQTNADSKTWAWTYRADHTLQTVKDPNGTVSTHSYDVSDRLTRIVVAPVASVVSGTTLQTFEYDGLDRLTVCLDNNGEGGVAAVVSRVYDSRSRVLQETQNGKAIQSIWDIDNNRLKCNYPNGRILATTYDGIDRPIRCFDESAVEVVAEWSWIGKGVRGLQRVNGDGSRLSFLSPSSAVPGTPLTALGFGYDAARRVTRQRSLLPGATVPFLDRQHEYNRANVRTAEIRHQDGGQRDSYTYDSLYRVVKTELDTGGTGIRRTSVRSDYALDPVGNRTLQTFTDSVGVVTSVVYVPNTVNEYVTVGGASRTYSDNGNLLESDRFKFQYDFRNRLIAVIDSSDVLVARYTYDCQNRRVGREVVSGPYAGTRAAYYYDGWRVIEERDPRSDTPTKTYVYGPSGIDSVVQLQRHDSPPATVYLHQNVRGDIAAITTTATDGTVAVAERRYYDDFGRAYDDQKQPVLTSAMGNPYGFQGRRLDPETGFYYFRNRMYNPAEGRFLQRDPVWDPANYGNQYAFASNGPISGSDPTGTLTAKEGADGAAKVAGALTGWSDVQVTANGIKGAVAEGHYGRAAVFGVGIAAQTVDASINSVPILGTGKALAGRVVKSTIRVGIAALKAGRGVARVAREARAIQLARRAGSLREKARILKAGGVSQARRRQLIEEFRVCFLAGTHVVTDKGAVPIEKIKVGDRVLSRDDSTGAQGYNRVVRLFRGETNRVVHLRIAKAASVQRGRSQRHRVGQGKGGSSSDGEEGSEPARSEADGEQTIRSTVGHPYYVFGRGWVRAEDLKDGDQLSGSRGEVLVVTGLEIREEQAKHFNFEVEGFHTYFVSETERDPAVWVHNTKGFGEGCGGKIFRADDAARGGQGMGVPRSLDVYDFDADKLASAIADHVLDETPTLFRSFSSVLRDKAGRGAAFFTKSGRVFSVPRSAIDERKLLVLEADDVADIFKMVRKKKIRRKAAGVLSAMRKNHEILIHGEIPAHNITQIRR